MCPVATSSAHGVIDTNATCALPLASAFWLACLRQASWITVDSFLHDEDFSTDQRRCESVIQAIRSKFVCSRPACSGLFFTGRSSGCHRALLALATSVWSNAVTSCSAARQRCRRVQSDVTTSVTQDAFYARERFARTRVAGSRLGISRIWQLSFPIFP